MNIFIETSQQRITTFLTTLDDKIAIKQNCLVQETTPPLNLVTQLEMYLEK